MRKTADREHGRMLMFPHAGERNMEKEHSVKNQSALTDNHIVANLLK